VSGDGDFGAVMERMRRIRADLSPVDGAARFRDLGVDVFLGHGRFVADDTVEVDGRRLRFHRAVVATGARAFIPPIEGMDGVACLTNETVFSLTERPAHLAVLGGGPIGCELGQAFARFGSRVTLLEAGPRILTKDDADAAEVVANALRRDGVHLHTGAHVDGVEDSGPEIAVRYTRGGAAETLRASHLLVAVGRAPNVDGMGLEAAGIDFDAKGVAVDDRMRTSNPRVYAIGDVASRFQLTHAADAQARMVVRNALFYGRGKASGLVIPWCTYTAPELAHVGIAPDEVAEAGDEVRTITIPLAEVDRARTDGETEGFLRVHLRAGSDTILGGTMVGPHAGEIISQVTQAMTAGIGLGKVGAAIFPYPTLAEALRKAADAMNRERLTPAARRAFGLFFRATG
jgi:pyruvate/2-oxoglutarate dehydrogenase complex dihydrolipoamide dehydrogenase (E3) component